MKAPKVWFGDHVFDQDYAWLLKDIEEIGSWVGFTPVPKSSSPTVAVMFNPSFLILIQTFLHPELRHIPKYSIITEPQIVRPDLGWKIFNRWVKMRVILGGMENQTIVKKPHRLSAGQKYLGSETNRSNKAVLVNRFKISMLRGENYSLRRESVRQLRNLDVYGSGWDTGWLPRVILVAKESVIAMLAPANFGVGAKNLFVKPRTYKGEVLDKIRVMSKYKVALVIENSF